MPSVIRSFVAVPKDVREWTKFFEGLFYANTCELTLTGCTFVNSADVRYSVSAGVVVLDMPSLQGTSNTTAATLTTLPTHLRPRTAKTAIARVTDNGTTAFGLFSIATDGVITLRVNAAGSAVFTGSGVKGVQPCAVVYQLD